MVTVPRVEVCEQGSGPHRVDRPGCRACGQAGAGMAVIWWASKPSAVCQRHAELSAGRQLLYARLCKDMSARAAMPRNLIPASQLSGSICEERSGERRSGGHLSHLL